MFFLMELQGGTYDSIMGMPYSRRKRFVEQKGRLEESRRSQAEQQAASARRHARRRR